MIPQAYITEWANQMPWQTNEQDLQLVFKLIPYLAAIR